MYSRIVFAIALALLLPLAAAEEPAKPISGTVVDEQGQPLAGATVKALTFVSKGWGKSTMIELASMETGADGRFHFDAQRAKKCAAILAEKPGKSFDGKFLRDGEMSLRLGPATAINGVVMDDAGQPVIGAAVNLLFHEPTDFLPEYVFMKKTDSQGRFGFSNLPVNAAFKFDISASGYARSLAEGPFLSEQKGLRFVLPPEGRIEGMVVEKSTGKPLSNVRLSAMSGVASGQHTTYAKTDMAGRFTMSGLSGGKYKIETVGEIVDDEMAMPEWMGTVEKVKVEAGKLTSNVRIKVIRGGLLEIIVVDAATGRKVRENGILMVSPANDLRVSRWGAPSKDGVVRFYLPPGEYVVTGAMSVSYAFKTDKSGPYSVEEGKTNRVTITVDTGRPKSAGGAGVQTSSVSGIICDTGGKPVPHAKILVLPLTGEKKELIADDHGRFFIQAADIGLICCFAWMRHPKENLVALGIAALGQSDPDEDKLAGAGIVVIRTKPRKIILRPPVNLVGIVSDPEGKPIDGACVSAQVDGSHMGRSEAFLTTTTDKEGKYKLALAPFTITSYAISAKAPGYSTAEVVVGPLNNILHG